MIVEPVRLEGAVVRLEPLRLDDAEALADIGLSPDLWRWQPTIVTTRAGMRAYVAKALDEQRRGASLPFKVVVRATGQLAGSTRYMDIQPAHRRLEIGSTWYAPAYQRTAVNTETKLLLLTHAFERLGAVRVVLKTDALNERSRAAILRLGAREDGHFRKHMVTDTGRWRDVVYFSILDADWPTVKAGLEAKLARRTGGRA